MDKTELHLAEEKKLLESVEAPEELETRLRNALNRVAPARHRRIGAFWKIAAVVLIVFAVSGNQYNAFSYYGKLLLGFDGVVNDSLKELNEAGLGQTVDVSKTYEDGTTLTINGLMSDANQLIVYYTLSNPAGLKKDELGVYDKVDPIRISGFWTDSDSNGGTLNTSEMNEIKTEYKGYQRFNRVSPFAKKLTMHFWIKLEDGTRKSDMITFPYDPNKALKSHIEHSFNQEITTDIGTLSLDSIIATPTMTEINGIFSANEDTDHFMMVDGALEGVELIANGTLVNAGMAEAKILQKDNKIEIKMHYGELPQPLHSLEIKINELPSYKLIDRKLPFSSSKDQLFNIEGKEIRVKDVSRSSTGVRLTLAYDSFDIITKGMSLGTKSGLVPMKTSEAGNHVKQLDGKEYSERTLIFETKENPEYLYIEKIYYKKPYDITINVPLE
ncbi:DUF4179 domain-containing protein [Paenibacillus pasadenensis]|uniref:DUF4179 domain-containing protein n=1 Tax=Paenibacillus pasadenensis TaxID=217090 RepID=UPI00203E85A1|nr:DUF4179 domain-containing protein [Paenibacillus pasadenensis]MCM3749764.1 DUF4179 domain-containing protein [Paenibacillus pasadenensis]